MFPGHDGREGDCRRALHEVTQMHAVGTQLRVPHELQEYGLQGHWVVQTDEQYLLPDCGWARVQPIGHLDSVVQFRRVVGEVGDIVKVDSTGVHTCQHVEHLRRCHRTEGP